MAPTEDEILFPVALRSHGVLLGGEYAWPPHVVRDVIEFLRRQKVAVLGVEVWLREGKYPKVLAGSEYEVSPALDWDSYVDPNAAQALADIERRQVPEKALFNLTWATEMQSRRLRR
jgi:hypothetical protein